MDQAGAAYDRHWAFVSPKSLRFPATAIVGGKPDRRLPRQSMNEHGFEPSEPAPPHMLLRRLYLDLTGLPPAPEEVEAFARESSQEAYVRIVDRFWPPLPTGKSGGASGWILPATPTPMATKRTDHAACGPTATG